MRRAVSRLVARLRIPGMRIWTLATIAMVLLAAGPASAQADGGTWLEGAARDAAVRVRLVSGERVSGRVFDVHADRLELATAAGPRTIARTAIVDVRQRHRDSVGNGAVIGASIGAAAMLGLVAALSPVFDCDGCAGQVAIATTVWAGAGAGIGALVDAAIRRDVVVYEAAPRVSWAPVVGRGAAGLRMSVRF
jgi:hypothetical protein